MPEITSQSPGTPSGATLNPKGIYQFTGVRNHAKTSVLDKRFSGPLEELWVQRAQFTLIEPVWREKSVLVGSLENQGADQCTRKSEVTIHSPRFHCKSWPRPKRME